MNQIPVFSQSGRDVSLSIAEQCSALLTRLFVVALAFAEPPPPPRPWRASRRGEPDAETQKCLCKHMISRRLRRKRGKISHEGVVPAHRHNGYTDLAENGIGLFRAKPRRT